MATKEPTQAQKDKYATEQAAWLAKHNLKTGSLVSIRREPADYERGWDYESVESGYGDLFGKDELYELGSIHKNTLEVVDGYEYGYFPYFCLKPVSPNIRRVAVTEEYAAIVSKKGVSIPGESTFTWKTIEDLSKLSDFVHAALNESGVEDHTFGSLTLTGVRKEVRIEECIVKGLINGYSVLADEDYLSVGCQEVEWDVVDELLRIRKEINK